VRHALTFNRLKWLSFTHSGVYAGLLVLWLTPGEQAAEAFFGWGHGIGWIVMSLLAILAVRLRVISLWLGVLVAVVGGIGPFAGSAGFVWEERRARRPTARVQRGMV
jgi:hypothetical protein